MINMVSDEVTHKDGQHIQNGQLSLTQYILPLQILYLTNSKNTTALF